MPASLTPEVESARKGKIGDILREHQERYLDLSEAADDLGVSEVTYRRFVKRAGGHFRNVPVFPSREER